MCWLWWIWWSGSYKFNIAHTTTQLSSLTSTALCLWLAFPQSLDLPPKQHVAPKELLRLAFFYLPDLSCYDSLVFYRG